ncbi:hypothetical protein JMM81_02830 [Bacillus sp. V3B]|uniref:YpoC family protein n=1 Tax=Bacillus sp. V3B TaxID=2804915 RepID=UPI00210A27CA|nr:hypothetical protein [Bacillus sp. V3B]MCQ6273913.1 hypothetical protein [Bacillus sp. V3B]
MADQKIPFPQEYFKFSIHKEISWHNEYDQVFNPQTPFMYEAAYLYGLKTLMPWKMSVDTVPVVMKEWETVKMELHEEFSKRKLMEVEQPMRKGIGLFIEVLYWCNEYPAVSLNKDDDRLRIKPVNLQERLHFILSYPYKYHSYVQLTELFSEIEKTFRVQQVTRKAKTT